METSTTPAATVVAAPDLANAIVKTPRICSGQPRIAGTRIKVKHIYVWAEQMGMMPARIVAQYPQLTRGSLQLNCRVGQASRLSDTDRRDACPTTQISCKEPLDDHFVNP